MKDSVLTGLDHIAQKYGPTADDAWLLAPADMPLLDHELIDRILAAYDPANPRIVVPECQGQRGHPVLFSWRLVEEVKRLSPDEGLNVLRRRHGAQYVVVSDRGALADIDTPDDYQRLHAAHGGMTAGKAVEGRPAT
jgi:molybdenum cofactor cytidylyltransferase